MWKKLLFQEQKRHFTKLKCKYKLLYKNNEGKRSSYLAKTNSKLFWKNINNQYKQKSLDSSKLNVNDMYRHFDTLYKNHDMKVKRLFPHTQKLQKRKSRQSVFAQSNAKSPGSDNFEGLVPERYKCSFERKCFFARIKRSS